MNLEIVLKKNDFVLVKYLCLPYHLFEIITHYQKKLMENILLVIVNINSNITKNIKT